ncbi:hypothetical protein OM076_14595 [Solirubrobacter ginsenosidimutans]|uniref:Uncharacterized protein n=1 Tax=Solirubrobacter ginsenosidimutans TaxID=490573 RepID=A0A9X3MSD2_9ACTN|nr:hypothetical protein [Solirubrobacter ginsenosidimutans]MDA0161502.1 hypothetical protein [Solirubrobacter ginsenosidimutans]
MEATTAVAPPQRVCPNCARLSWATGPTCPYCTARFRSGRAIAPWMLAVAVGVVLLGMVVLFVIAGQIAQHRVDDRIEQINQDFDTSLNKFRTDVQKELDARLPAAGAAVPPAVPTATPFATETPAPATTPDAGATATAEPTVTATKTASPTATPSVTIGPG